MTPYSAAFIKKAAIYGIVCMPVAVTTHVAHRPISQAIAAVRHRVYPRQRVVAASRLRAAEHPVIAADCPIVLPVMSAPLVPVETITEAGFTPIRSTVPTPAMPHPMPPRSQPVIPPPAIPLPEPATWAMIGLGVAVTGYALRRGRVVYAS